MGAFQAPAGPEFVVVTIFPDAFPGPLGRGVVGRAHVELKPAPVVTASRVVEAGETGAGAVTAVWMVSRRLFDERQRLRLDRLRGGATG